MFRLQLGHPTFRISPLNSRSPVTSLRHPCRFSSYAVILPHEPFVFGVSHITPRSVPKHIARPPYAGGSPALKDPGGRIELGGAAEQRLRAAAQLAKKVREYAGTLVQVAQFVCGTNITERFAKANVTTNEVDAAVHEYIVEHSAYPSPLLYSGFPRSCCTR